MKPISILSGTTLLAAAITASAGCSAGTGPVPAAITATAAAPADASATASGTVALEPSMQTSAGPLPTVLVHKSASCGCCGAWIEHLQQAGFTVQVDERDDLEPIRKELGVPPAKGSCHTAEVAGYVVEGHVPAQDIKRLLAEKPRARGLTVPGMPIGSPGMESPDGRIQPYTVELIGLDGGTSAYANHGP